MQHFVLLVVWVAALEHGNTALSTFRRNPRKNRDNPKCLIFAGETIVRMYQKIQNVASFLFSTNRGNCKTFGFAWVRGHPVYLPAFLKDLRANKQGERFSFSGISCVCWIGGMLITVKRGNCKTSGSAGDHAGKSCCDGHGLMNEHRKDGRSGL